MTFTGKPDKLFIFSVLYSNFIDTFFTPYVSFHCMILAEAVAEFSFGGGQAPRGPEVTLIQNRKLGGFGPLFSQKGPNYFFLKI